jgi:hypothetical protein
MAGRPRLHTNQADKQHAYRQRQREKRDAAADRLAAWQTVRAAAQAAGVLIGDEPDFRAAQLIARALEDAADRRQSDGNSDVRILLPML